MPERILRLVTETNSTDLQELDDNQHVRIEYKDDNVMIHVESRQPNAPSKKKKKAKTVPAHPMPLSGTATTSNSAGFVTAEPVKRSV